MSLPDGLEAIRTAAFQDCQSLGEVDVPKSVEEIGSLVFSGCSSLSCVLMQGRTQEEALALDGCPWGAAEGAVRGEL